MEFTHRINQLLSDHVLYRGGHRLRRDGVDLRPSETKQPVVPSVLEETRTELLGELNCLAWDSDIRHGDVVRVDIAGSR